MPPHIRISINIIKDYYSKIIIAKQGESHSKTKKDKENLTRIEASGLNLTLN